MKWEEIETEEIEVAADSIYEYVFDIDEFLNYWALQADPRYREDKALFDMEQACGGDY